MQPVYAARIERAIASWNSFFGHLRFGRARTATRAELMHAVDNGLTRGLRFAIALERRSRGTNPRWRGVRAMQAPAWRPSERRAAA